jgi:hypothetical protein
MEHSLLTPRDIVLKNNGIPFSLITHLLKDGRSYTHNLKNGFGYDSDLNIINEMEKNLPALTLVQIDKRSAADFCCIWRYDYPERVFDICEIIGGGDNTALRLHYQISPQRRQDFIDYADALKGWLEDISPDNSLYFRHGSEDTVNKVYGFLGDKDPLKKLLVERTYIGLSSRFLNCSFWGSNNSEKDVNLFPNTAQQLPDDSYRRMLELESRISKEMGSLAGNFLIDVGGSSEPACHFKFIRRVDILVSSIGCLQWRGNLPEKDENIKERRKITKLFLDILEKYLKKDNYDENYECETEKKVFELLGKPDEFKRWLVACLWKNIKNQTQTHSYPMKRWAEFVRIGEKYLDSIV